KALGFSSLPSTRNSSSREIRLGPPEVRGVAEALAASPSAFVGPLDGTGSCARAWQGSSIVDKTPAPAKTEKASVRVNTAQLARFPTRFRLRDGLSFSPSRATSRARVVGAEAIEFRCVAGSAESLPGSGGIPSLFDPAARIVDRSAVATEVVWLMSARRSALMLRGVGKAARMDRANRTPPIPWRSTQTIIIHLAFEVFAETVAAAFAETAASHSAVFGAVMKAAGCRASEAALAEREVAGSALRLRAFAAAPVGSAVAGLVGSAVAELVGSAVAELVGSALGRPAAAAARALGRPAAAVGPA